MHLWNSRHHVCNSAWFGAKFTCRNNCLAIRILRVSFCLNAMRAANRSAIWLNVNTETMGRVSEALSDERKYDENPIVWVRAYGFCLGNDATGQRADGCGAERVRSLQWPCENLELQQCIFESSQCHGRNAGSSPRPQSHDWLLGHLLFEPRQPALCLFF